MRTLQIYLIRHGETEWSLSGQHTGRKDIPLTHHGEVQARRVGRELRGIDFKTVLSSPLQRARRTCELAGLARRVRIDPDLMEWNYGRYEGQTLREIRRGRPHWTVFRNGAPGGESAAQIGRRADRVIHRLRKLKGNVAIFSHGHFLRVLAARWVGIPASKGECLALDTGAISILSYEHQEVPVLMLWNALRIP